MQSFLNVVSCFVVVVECSIYCVKSCSENLILVFFKVLLTRQGEDGLIANNF